MATIAPDVTQEVFVTGLKNAHGVEHQALALIDRQLDHLANYPEVADILRAHRVETEQQIQRIDEILASFDETASGLKDAVLSFTGNLAAIAHLPAPDEILKNQFANHAFENFEIAAYTSLITLSDHSYAKFTPLLQQSLGEEKKTAQLIIDSVPLVTQKYLSLRAAGETASH